MNKEEIDKWLDNEYGVSYTRLEELHDFLIEQNMKYQDKIDILQQENKQLKERIEVADEFCDRYMGVRLELFDMYELLNKIREILGDKENE